VGHPPPGPIPVLTPSPAAFSGDALEPTQTELTVLRDGRLCDRKIGFTWKDFGCINKLIREGQTEILANL
jgi:hypothetical protein